MIGEQWGPIRRDWGEQWAELRCTSCRAEWVGPIGEGCAWCAGKVEAMKLGQAELLLRPELPDRNDKRRAVAVRAWGERLARGVKSGVVIEADARRAWGREA